MRKWLPIYQANRQAKLGCDLGDKGTIRGDVASQQGDLIRGRPTPHNLLFEPAQGDAGFGGAVGCFAQG